MTQQETPRVIGVRHAALSARDPAELAGFYQEVLGLQAVPTDTAALGAAAFLGSRPSEGQIDLVFFANPAYQHTAFEVGSLADLRAFHQRVAGRGVPIKMALNHGVTLSFYFEDPEGHMIEIYWPTGAAVPPRHGEPIDLTQSEDTLRRELPGSPGTSRSSSSGAIPAPP